MSGWHVSVIGYTLRVSSVHQISSVSCQLRLRCFWQSISHGRKPWEKSTGCPMLSGLLLNLVCKNHVKCEKITWNNCKLLNGVIEVLFLLCAIVVTPVTPDREHCHTYFVILAFQFVQPLMTQLNQIHYRIAPKLTSVFCASVLLLIMNFITTLSK